MSQFFTSGGQSIWVSASVLPMNIQGWFLLRIDWLDLLAVQGTFKSLSRDFQESSLSPQFESINSSVFSLRYDPTLTSIHDYWKNHSFDYVLGLGLIFFCSPTVANESLIISYQGTPPAFTVGFSIACWSLITFHYLFPGYQWHSNKYPIPFSL